MNKRVEVGMGSVVGERRDSFALGKSAAQQALAQITLYAPSLILVFASVKYALPEMLQGIRSVSRQTPLIGTSTAGEIADGFQEGGIVVLILASPYLRVSIGVGEHVSEDPQRSVDEATAGCELDTFLVPESVRKKTGRFAGGKQGDILAIMFSPGSTKVTPSPSQTILRILKRKTQNRLPVFGGSSGDDLSFARNYQLADARVLTDSVVLCLIETELKFGLAVEHGFTPTASKAMVTRAEDHRVIELDQRPAAEVYAELTRLTRRELAELQRLRKHLTRYTKTPLGLRTDCGEYVLRVPDFIQDDNSIVFTSMIFENTVLTLMEGSLEKLLVAASNAVDKAMLRGGIGSPALVLLFPCVLRRILFEREVNREPEIVKKRIGSVPLAGFYTYGEQNMSDDNVLTYYNETASVLVLGNELSEVARGNQENERLYAQLQETIRDLEQANAETMRKARELSAAMDQVQKADRLKSEFLASMSHELRTPLNSIIGFTGILLQGLTGELTAEQKKQLGMVYDSARHLLKLINDILDLSKIEAGKIEVIPVDFEPKELFRVVEKMVFPMIKEKGLTLVTEIGEDVPATLYADKNRIKQVVLNLLSNAIKFTEAGTIRLTVRSSGLDAKARPTEFRKEKLTGSLSSASSLLVAVSDVGIGIRPEHLEDIFDEFRQLEGPLKEKPYGTGLGLAISRKMVEMMGGRIWAESDGRQGATFQFTIPIPVREESGAKKPMVLPVTIDPDKKLILTIDDEVESQDILAVYLKEYGYEVIQAYNAGDALETARKLQPFAITLDIMMPGKDGWDILHELKEDPRTRNTPVICISILDNREMGLSLGAIEYLVKPIEQDELIEELQRLGQRFSIHDILIVDDEPGDLELLARYLEGEDHYEVRKAPGGAEGLAMARQKRPDLIILDLLMPETDGFEVICQLKKSQTLMDVPVIIVSGKELSREEKVFLNANIEKIIRKGEFKRDDLLDGVRHLLDKFKG